MIQTLDPMQVVTSGVQSATAGTVMKSTFTGSGLGGNSGSPGTNTSGFSGLPGGYRVPNGSFISIRSQAFFWSATEDDNNDAWRRLLENDYGHVGRNNNRKLHGASVRCLKD